MKVVTVLSNLLFGDEVTFEGSSFYLDTNLRTVNLKIKDIVSEKVPYVILISVYSRKI